MFTICRSIRIGFVCIFWSWAFLSVSGTDSKSYMSNVWRWCLYHVPRT